MKRRNFIKLTSTASVLSLLPSEVFSMFTSVTSLDCKQLLNAKKLVLIQLSGANDGLNTIVPLNQYDKYVALRPTIKLSNSGLNSVINLDTTLGIGDQVGLHPSLTGFKSLYDAGRMRVIQGVGYPRMNGSHFKSTDLWHSGGDGTARNFDLGSGWLGRFLENHYERLPQDKFPLGVQLAGTGNSSVFKPENEENSINITGQDPAGFYTVVNGLGGEPPATIPTSEYGDLIRYIIENDQQTTSYAQSISTAFGKGKNTLTYPTTDLSNQLKTVAKLISGGLGTKVYLVTIGGWDTHDRQVASADSSHTGGHANLLKTLSDAINNFITDINSQGLGGDVVAVTYSEFGRTPRENANLGTDHGRIAPMFVFGTPVNPGVSGTNVNLDEIIAANQFQFKTVQHDYRSVFGTILKDWLGTTESTLDLAFYDYTNNSGFNNSRLSGLIKTNHLACDPGIVTAVEPLPVDGIMLFPNPTPDILNVAIANEIVQKVSILNTEGKHLSEFKNHGMASEFAIDLAQIPSGFYIAQIETNLNQFTRRVIVRR
jgi:uncharacterized protein (DUF1501 family)